MFGNTPQGFVVEILRHQTNVVLEEMFLSMTINIIPGEMLASVMRDNEFRKAKVNYTFNLTLQNSLTSDDYIQIKMDDSWIFYEDECEAISGITLIEGNDLKCENTSDGTNSFLKISNF